MKVELAADPAGQERLGPAIFGVADDRMADRRHVRAQLVGAAGQRLQLDPGGAVAGAVDSRQRVLAGSPCSSPMCIFSPPVPGCLAERRVDQPLVADRARRRPAPNRPCARSGRKRPWRNGRPRARVRATSSAPDVSLSSRWTSLGRPLSSARPSSSRSRCWVVLVPPCVARPGGLLSTNALRVLDRSPCRGRTALRPRSAGRASAAAARTAPASPRPAERGSPAPPRSGRRAPPACRRARSCPVRAQRETMLKLTSGMWRLNQRSSRMPSSSSVTVKVRGFGSRRGAISEC